MTILQAFTTSFCGQVLQGYHNFNNPGHTFKMALYSDSANLDWTTTEYTTTGEVVAAGYTAGGAALTNLGVQSSGQTGFTSFGTVTWNSGLTARGALIYNATPGGGLTNPSVMVLNFGIDRSSPTGVFTVTFPTFNAQSAIIQINAPAG